MERALISNTIASGKPISRETMNKIKRYRSIVEQSLGQVLLLKDLPSTPGKMKQAIEGFEKEFLQSYQTLREKVFEASKKQEDDINKTISQIVKIKAAFLSYLHGVTTDLLNIGENKNIIALAQALQENKKAPLPILITWLLSAFDISSIIAILKSLIDSSKSPFLMTLAR